MNTGKWWLFELVSGFEVSLSDLLVGVLSKLGSLAPRARPLDDLISEVLLMMVIQLKRILLENSASNSFIYGSYTDFCSC